MSLINQDKWTFLIQEALILLSQQLIMNLHNLVGWYNLDNIEMTNAVSFNVYARVHKTSELNEISSDYNFKQLNLVNRS